jgi:hypothetical protein
MSFCFAAWIVKRLCVTVCEFVCSVGMRLSLTFTGRPSSWSAARNVSVNADRIGKRDVVKGSVSICLS